MKKYRVITKTTGFLGTMENDYDTLEEAIERKERDKKDHYKPVIKIYEVVIVEKLKLVK